ncbi:MAG: hypothetical protein HOY79_01580 [Streptomyces sp.]|nr:hypothetical protein [Streptomyces sp.]
MAAKVTATAKKTASKRPSRQLAPAPEPEPESSPFDPASGGEFEVLRLTRRSDRAEERVPLFYIDDVEYTVVKRPHANVGLKMLELLRTQGEPAAQAYVLGKLLGPDGYAALLDYDDLTAEHYAHICKVAAKLALGSLELPKE